MMLFFIAYHIYVTSLGVAKNYHNVADINRHSLPKQWDELFLMFCWQTR